MSNSSSGSSLPAGYLPPFSTVTDDDHSAWIIIATALGLACVLVFVTARVVVRYSMISSFMRDDWLLASSVFMTIVQSCVVLYGCSVGLGASMVHLPSQQQIRIEKIFYTSNLLWVISLGLSKICVATLLQRIDAFGRREKFFYTIIGFLAVWTVASLFAIALQCNPAQPWITLNERCADVLVRWQVICAFDIVTELVLFASSIYLVRDVQTLFSRKITIVAGFSCRLLMIVPIGFRLATYDQTGISDDPSLRETLFMVWTQTELNYSIISATIPSLLQFMRNLNTSFGGLKEDSSRAYGSRQRSSGNFPMSVLRSFNKMSSSNQKSERTEDEDEEELTESPKLQTPAPKHPDLTSKDSMGSSDSQRMIIHKAVTYSVEYN